MAATGLGGGGCDGDEGTQVQYLEELEVCPQKAYLRFLFLVIFCLVF